MAGTVFVSVNVRVSSRTNLSSVEIDERIQLIFIVGADLSVL